MVKWSAIALISLGIIHMLVLGAEIPAELPNWLSLNLWTWDHWAPLRAQPLDLALSGGVFWQSIGSLAIPLVILGALILWLDRRSLPIPVFVGWGLLVWTAIMTAIMPPSGLTVVFVVSVFLTVGLQVRSRKRGNSPAA
ncbi:DUF6463 family protein [Aminobacter sp. NyZ550]|jgi:hypothetical protein|uniref:Tryptophan-rich sensory protein n=1 Tax=Aminobacter ciceronei TaxID=150723 RepID=A0ABR6C1Q3_9HYPH|nr:MULTISPECIES: DUF6463 family protein [Aminobacter]WMC95017.1 DUF6463 family protein [Aminobacter aminovorans]MBA8904804.1 hypothetical protein [Aminobacter ciceronei]MBA9018642.1 hypothetical protein [Aminobacter ciceronei]MRX31514.1 hypothetical protein [Aminobacter sp. MDW-2]QNH32015.1 hypothetical protein H5P29_15650 [Aminobacter sp. MDW-2]